MTTLIFVRHGQSMGNMNNVFLGHTDLDLSEKGYRQAEITAEYIVENYKINKIYSSDLIRAYHTAYAVAKRLNLPIVKDKALREIYAGDWENRSFDDLMSSYPKEYGTWRNDIGNAKCVNGESPKDLLERVLPKVIEIAEQNDGGTVLIATHATVIRTLECVWRSVGFEKMKDIPWVSNASVSVVQYSNGEWKIQKIGDELFMGNMASLLPPNV